MARSSNGSSEADDGRLVHTVTGSRLWLYAKGRRLPLAMFVLVVCVCGAAALQNQSLIAPTFTSISNVPLPLLMLPVGASVAAGSLASPTGDLDRSDTGALRPARLWHVAVLGLLGTGVGLLVGLLLCTGTAAMQARAFVFWYGLALMSTVMFGGQWCWVLPSLSVIAHLAAIGYPGSGTWSWIDAPITAIPASILTLASLTAGLAVILLGWRRSTRAHP